jgi:hypothetical protein
VPIEFSPEEQAILSGKTAGRTPPPSRSVAPRRESPSSAPSSSPPRGKLSAGGGNPSKAQEKPPRQSWWDWGAGIAKGVGTAIVRAPAAALGGLLDTASDIGDAAGDAAASQLKKLGPKSSINRAIINTNNAWNKSSVGKAYNSYFDQDLDGRPDFADTLSGRNTVGKFGNDTANQLTTDILAVGLSAFTGGAAASGTKLYAAATATRGRALASAAIGGGVAEAVVLDPEQERFSNFLNDAGLGNDFTEYLATSGDDSNLEGRFKSAIEGSFVGAAAETVFKLGKFWRATAKGDTATAQAIAKEVSDEVDAKALSEGGLPIPPSREIVEATPETVVADRLNDAFDTRRTMGLSDETTSTSAPSKETPPSNLAGAELPRQGLSVANVGKDGKIYVGKRGDNHGDLMNAHPATTTGGGFSKVGFINPEGKFLSREEALEWVKASGDNIKGTQGAAGEKWLDAGDYRDQTKTLLRPSILEGRLDYQDNPARMTPQMIAEDANAALKKAGVEGADLDPATLDITPDGRIRVTDEVKRALDEEGLGKAFAGTADDIPDDAILLQAAARGDDPRTQFVGAISRKELDDISAEADAWAAKPKDDLDVNPQNSPNLAKITGDFKVGNLGSGAQARSVIRAIAQRLPETVRRDSESMMEMAQKAADEMGLDRNVLLEAARKTAGNFDDLDTNIVTLRTLWTRASNAFDGMDSSIGSWETASEADFLSAVERIREIYSLGEVVQQAKSGLGRGLQAIQLPDADTYLADLKAGFSGKLADDLAGEIDPAKGLPVLPTTRKELGEWAEIWRETRSEPALRQDFLEGMLRKTIPSPNMYLRQAFANFFTASILSGPRTIALNVVGPTLQRTLRTAYRTGGALRGTVGLSRQGREEAANVLQATARSAVAFDMLSYDALSWAIKSMSEGRSVLNNASSLDRMKSYTKLTENMLNAAQVQPGLRYSLGNLVNAWPRAFQRVNAGLDDFSQRLTYMAEVRLSAILDAQQQGLKGDDLKSFVKERMKNSIDETGRARDELASAAAARTSFLNIAGEQGTNTRALGRLISAAREKTPELRYILPVYNTPANALGETLATAFSAFDPLGGSEALRGMGLVKLADDLKGVHGPIPQAEAHGRFIAGATLAGIGFTMTREGNLTGGGPPDPRDRKAWRDAGFQPYSIKIGDEWVDYRKFDVLGGILSIPATLMDTTVNRPQDKEAGNLILAGIGALSQWMTDRASLQTISALLGSLSQPGAFGGKAETLLKTIGSGFVPAPVRSTGVELVDPVSRRKSSWEDYLKASIPGLSAELPPMRNVLGQPIMRIQDSIAESFLPIAFAPVNPAKDGDITEELYAVYRATGYGAGNDPQSIGNGVFDAEEVALENGESLASNFSRIRGEVKVDGKDLPKALRDLINSKAYKDGVYGSSTNKEDALGKASRSYMVSKLFSKYNKAARREIAQTSPMGEAYLIAADLKKASPNLLGEFTARELVANPELYTTKGIDMGASRAKVRGEDDSDSLMTALGL